MDDKTKPENHIYKELLEKSHILFLVLDRDGIIQSANSYAKQELGKQITGTSFETVLLDFHNTFDLLSIEENTELVRPLNLKRNNGLPQTYQFRFKFAGPVIYAVGELDNEDLEIVRKEMLSLNEDLNNLTRELHKKNGQLEMLNQEKNQFLGMAAHDLRKPIGLILSYSDFLIDEATACLDKEQIGFLHTIQKSCSFMKRLVDDFLDVSAIEAGKFDLELTWVHLSDVLEQSLRLTLLQANRKGQNLSIKADPGLPRLQIDPSKIEQVITNLISNAIEHSHERTKINIRLTIDADSVLFSVQDHGPGIPPGEMSKLFKPFGKTSTPKTGGEKTTGLGMLIARKIIEAHNGKINVKSIPGQGATFFFTLPVTGKGA